MTFRLRHLLAALLLHGLLIALLASGVQCTRAPVRPPVIHAVLLDPDRKQQEAQRKRAEVQRRAEQRRKAEAEKQRAEDAQRKKLEEAQRQKELADKKKAEELARRKKEQEDQARREAQEQARMEEAIRQEALRRELEREQAARAASERDRRLAEWADALQRHVRKYWIRPAGGAARFECKVRVEQLPDGTVTSARIERSCGDAALDRSVEDAVLRASPLPRPADPSVFERDLVINFKPGVSSP